MRHAPADSPGLANNIPSDRSVRIVTDAPWLCVRLLGNIGREKHGMSEQKKSTDHTSIELTEEELAKVDGGHSPAGSAWVDHRKHTGLADQVGKFRDPTKHI